MQYRLRTLLIVLALGPPVLVSCASPFLGIVYFRRVQRDSRTVENDPTGGPLAELREKQRQEHERNKSRSFLLSLSDEERRIWLAIIQKHLAEKRKAVESFRPELQTIDSPGSGDFGFVSGLQKNTEVSSGIFGDNGNHVGPILDEEGRVPAKPIILIGP